MTLMCRFDIKRKCKYPQTWRYDGQREHLPTYSFCSCCLVLELRGDLSMSEELKQKILDIIYAGDWTFKDEEGNIVIPNFYQFGIENEDMIIQAIIETIQSSNRKVRK